MINQNELYPVILIGFICGVLFCIDKIKHAGEEKQRLNFIFILDLFRNSIYSTILACFIFWLSHFLTQDYQTKLGITGLISILGLDRALGFIEKIINLKR